MPCFKNKNMLIIAILFFCACNEVKNNNCLPTVKYDKDTINIGQVKKGDSANIRFELINNGDCDFYIKKIGVGCGCTKAIYDTSKIKPNEKSIISLKYKNKEDSGVFIKTIVVESNSSPTLHTLFIKGNGVN